MLTTAYGSMDERIDTNTKYNAVNTKISNVGYVVWSNVWCLPGTVQIVQEVYAMVSLLSTVPEAPT